MEISPWANTQATREVPCEKCGAPNPLPCRTPKGRRTPSPHVERLRTYRESIGAAEWRRRHTIKGQTVHEVMAEITGTPQTPRYQIRAHTFSNVWTDASVDIFRSFTGGRRVIGRDGVIRDYHGPVYQFMTSQRQP